MISTISNSSPLRRVLAVTTAFAALTVATSSIAEAPIDGVPSITVRYDDLNLSTAVGVNSLYRRISVAARHVCSNGHSRDLAVVAAADRCYATAVANAVSAVNNPRLAGVHAAHSSRG